MSYIDAVFWFVTIWIHVGSLWSFVMHWCCILTCHLLIHLDCMWSYLMHWCSILTCNCFNSLRKYVISFHALLLCSDLYPFQFTCDVCHLLSWIDVVFWLLIHPKYYLDKLVSCLSHFYSRYSYIYSFFLSSLLSFTILLISLSLTYTMPLPLCYFICLTHLSSQPYLCCCFDIIYFILCLCI